MTDTGTDNPLFAQRTLLAAVMWGGDIGPACFRKLLAHFGSLEAVTEATIEQLAAADARLSNYQKVALSQVHNRFGSYADLIAKLEHNGIAVISYVDDSYPPALNILRNPPPLLCLRGRITQADRHAVAIVGTRNPTREESHRAFAIAQVFATADITVVSGLAQGIDTAAHRGAVEAGGRTIAVLGSGIQRIYPPDNEALAEDIAEAGAIASEVPPDAAPSVGTLMARNRIIAALAGATVVVASGTTGGSLVTAKETTRQGKTVAAVVWDDSSEKRSAEERSGNRLLLSQGASPIRDDDHVQALCDLIRRQAAESPPQSPPRSHEKDTDPQLGLFD